MSSLFKMPEMNTWHVRAIWTGVVYALNSGLSATMVGIMDAAEGDSKRRLECALQGASAGTHCPAASDDDKTQNDAVFGLSITLMIMNMALLLFSILTTKNTWATGWHFWLQPGLQLANVGLYLGAFLTLAQDETFLDDANVDNNVFFTEASPYLVLLFGLIIVSADAVILNGLRFMMKGRCEIK